jgi:hypothetical protein
MERPSFNRPILYTSLLSELAQGIDGNHIVYASVVADEFTIRTPDALMNGQATCSLIKSCCPDIAEPNNLLLCDIQHLLASIKIATQGSELEIVLKCPKCSAFDPYEIDLQNVVPFLSASKWFTPLTLDNLKIYFLPPTYEEFSKHSITEFKLNKQLYTITQMESPEDYGNSTSELLDQRTKLNIDYQSGCLHAIHANGIPVTDKTYIKQWFEQCDCSIQKKIVAYIDEASKQSALADFSIACTECHAPINVPIDLDVSRQFRQKLITASEGEILDIIKQMGRETKALTNDLLKMIWFMRGSMSYSDAFSLTSYERQCIAKIIEENIAITKESGIAII